MDKFYKLVKEYVESSMLRGNIVKLDSNISVGDVYKIPVFGSLETFGFEYALLFLKARSYILLHQHINDIEQYKFVSGDIKNTGICLLSEYHEVARVNYDTIIESLKVSKFIIDNYNSYSVDQLNDYLILILEEKEKIIKELLYSSYQDINKCSTKVLKKS